MPEGDAPNALVTKFGGCPGWADHELEIVRSLGATRRRFDPHQAIVHENDPLHEVFLIQQGWTITHKVLPDGCRQIVSFPLPGDLVGLSDLVGMKSSTTIECLSPVVVSPIPVGVLANILVSGGRVGRALAWSAEQHNAITVERLVSVGRRCGMARMAHLILEFAWRLKMIGCPLGQAFELPISQYLLADALGLTPIHVNRVLKKLREAQLLTVRAGIVSIHDMGALMEVASFSPDYLSSSPLDGRGAFPRG